MSILLFKLPSNLHLAAFVANAVNHFSVSVLSETGGKAASAASEKLKSPRAPAFPTAFSDASALRGGSEVPFEKVCGGIALAGIDRE